jgi:hypothetical protein
MTTTSAQQAGPLSVWNNTSWEAWIQLWWGPHALWATWVVPHGSVAMPSLPWFDLDVRATFTDERTGVGYMAPVSIHRQGAVQLVARLRTLPGGTCFCLETEPGMQVKTLALANLTQGDVRFDAQFRHTPFALTWVLPANTRQALHAGGLALTATVNGLSTPAWPLDLWPEQVVLTCAEGPHGGPLIKLAPSGTAGSF